MSESPHKPKRAGSPTIYCHSLDCTHKYAWQCEQAEVYCHPKPCKKWRGAKNAYGYAVGKRDGKYVYIHRLRFEKEYGPIPEGKLLRNTCGTRHCVEPTHWRLPA